jgi:hypothetical protein
MKNELIRIIESNMKSYLNEIQIAQLNESLKSILNEFEVFKKDNNLSVDASKENQELLASFLSAKQIEGCCEKTIDYYGNTIFKMLESVNLKIESITTDDLRKYLAEYKNHGIIKNVLPYRENISGTLKRLCTDSLTFEAINETYDSCFGVVVSVGRGQSLNGQKLGFFRNI